MNNHSLKKNSILNVIRQICAVIFPFITFPYATRILGTGNYGKVAFGQSVISYMSLISCLGVIEYAVREGAKAKKDKTEFQKLSNQIFSINIISTIVAYLLLFTLMLIYPGFKGYITLLLVQSLCMIFTTLGTDWINMAYEDYLYIALRYIFCHIISLVLLFIIVRTSEDYVLYAFTCVLTDILANIANIIYIRKKYKIFTRFTFDIGGTRHLIPILILFGSTLASFVYINSDVIMLGILKNEDTVGIYSAAAKIYIAIKQVLNAALMVTIPRIAGNISIGKDNRDLLKKIRTASILILLPACAGLYTISNEIIILICGDAYSDAGLILKILSVALFFASSGCYYISVVLIPYGKEKNVLIGTVIAAVVNIILNLILIPRYGGIAAAMTTVLSELIMTATGLLSTRGITDPKLIKPYIISTINIIFIFNVSSIIKRSVGIIWIRLIIIVLLSVIFVAAVCTISFYKDIRKQSMN